MTRPHATSPTSVTDEFRRRLTAERQDILRTLALTEEELATLEAHQPGAGAEDAGTQAASALLSRLEMRQQRELDEIAEAMIRLGNGTFGLCERCHRPVPLARLRAMPAARHCVDCQKKLETQ
jgi:DnaK suppressor protein